MKSKLFWPRSILFTALGTFWSCATLIANGLEHYPHGGGQIGLTGISVGLLIDSAISYPIIIGATAPSFGWIYGGFAVFIYLINVFEKIFK
ncbi:hypothetical protein [Leptospira wolffii]|uniref:hypothetical protein n=1 Tax=Leptospira wolffii TaxID=409998 RepID=UPI0003026385|nr:hypothetical protein [Leptospira wolffii]EPG66335.1 putative lipoprotein [Leptospira wolffii serovar Khorat str. Khorat-H2]